MAPIFYDSDGHRAGIDIESTFTRFISRPNDKCQCFACGSNQPHCGMDGKAGRVAVCLSCFRDLLSALAADAVDGSSGLQYSESPISDNAEMFISAFILNFWKEVARRSDARIERKQQRLPWKIAKENPSGGNLS